MEVTRKDVFAALGVLLALALLAEYLRLGVDLTELTADVSVQIAAPPKAEVASPAEEGSVGADARGWHPERVLRERTVRRYAEAREARSEGLPFADPAEQDPGADYLPFPEDKVLPRYRNSSRLVYDTSVLRLSDDFGLVDDTYTPEELEDIFQLVVDIYARGNVYLRVNREDLSNVHKLSRGKSLEYLGYVEGPDLAELTALKEGKSSLGMSKRDAEFDRWFEAEYRKVYPFSLIESRVKKSSNLKKYGYTTDKYNFMRNLIDWIIGYPHMFTPWDLFHTTPMFPIYVFHGMNGECRGGRITGRAGSCWLPPKSIVDQTTGQFVKNMTCRRFAGGLKTRFGLKERFMRNSEKRVMLGAGAARMWAHEIGHSLGEHHPSSSCNLANEWSENNLMLQQRHVGKKGVGCPKTPTDDQAEGTAWTHKQIQRIRSFVRARDIRPSATLPNGRTVGGSTMQMGARSEPVFRRMVFNRAQMIGSGKSIRRKECELPQSVVVFTQLPSPIDGNVHRVRWLPSHWHTTAFEVRVAVVVPVSELGEDGPAKFEVVQSSGPLRVEALRQRSHVELDLPEPLMISKGQFVALSSVSGTPLNIDQQLYASDKVLYGDISGKLPLSGPSVHHEMMPYLEFETSYPKVALSHRAADHFYSSNKPIEEGAAAFEARTPARDAKDKWCLPLIFNYDVVLDL